MSEDNPQPPFEPVPEKVDTFGAEAPVTGQTKMQAAWSGNNDDESTSAQVASVQQGQIFEQIYQPWEGTLNPCLLYTSPSPRDNTTSRMPSSA